MQSALRDARTRLLPASDSAALDAQTLLGAALGVERAYLLAHPDQPLTAEQSAQFNTWVERCAAGEPLSYVLGRRAFYDRELIVTPDVLIPRPETELLLEAALAFAGSRALVAVDVGTGSGALAVTLAALCPALTVYATDISPAALDVARQNAALHGAAVTFLQGDLLSPLLERGIHADLIMANLPYIPSGDLPALAVTRWEPRLALDGGADGLDLVRRLLRQAADGWRAEGLMLLEIGYDQGVAGAALCREMFPGADVQVLRDYSGHDRILRVERK
ncbi:MAG: peptide chain release factor N(5)-glutamine methyltransferase [Anaerolineae bacterium]|nr:peptide chain release factor N(5)-glutamine methyltransferase [Anaerolineae bacterium]